MRGFKQRSKFGEKRTSGFGSGLEKAVHDLLVLREEKGEISEILCQQTVVLQGGPRKTRITWRADFSFINNETLQLWYCEAKGFANDIWPLKLKMLRYQKIKTEIWMGRAASPFLAEVIE